MRHGRRIFIYTYGSSDSAVVETRWEAFGYVRVQVLSMVNITDIGFGYVSVKTLLLVETPEDGFG